ncbi:uncharacterized protein TrAtP1_011951 [Trichoderma atroviride]|uniref:uncharacterized protein n=1 Tax=Hypocrea atroviridis TaxID=63577 RepID=UPI003318720F|nr:hypothetical protein TrAtP1_011951 [Trichoderma atroviride]
MSPEKNNAGKIFSESQRPLQSSTIECGDTVKASDESFVATVNSMVTVLRTRSNYL